MKLMLNPILEQIRFIMVKIFSYLAIKQNKRNLESSGSTDG